MVRVEAQSRWASQMKLSILVLFGLTLLHLSSSQSTTDQFSTYIVTYPTQWQQGFQGKIALNLDLKWRKVRVDRVEIISKQFRSKKRTLTNKFQVTVN